MKKMLLLSALLLITLLISSCLITFHPIFTEKDLVYDPRLSGSWVNEKGESTIKYRPPRADELQSLSTLIQRNASKIYVFEERDAQGKLKSEQFAFMVKLGKYYYMDYYPVGRRGDKEDRFFAAHYIPMHSIYRIKFKNDQSFDLQQLDAGYLETLIKNKKIRIRHEVTADGNYVITAPTEELQKYIVKYSDIPDAYSKDNSTSYSRMN